MIPISTTTSRIFRLKINFLTCVSKTVNGKSPEVWRTFSKDFQVNLEYFDTNLMGAVDCGREKFIVNCARVMADEDPS